MAIVTTYNLAPVPRWLFTDLTGKILSDGTMYTKEDLDHSMTKVAYKDPNGMTQWTDPIPFEINGMPNGALYWASDSDYYLAVFDRLDVPQFTISKYNAPFANEINPAPEFVTNYVRNAQFTYWNNGTVFTNPNTDLTVSSYLYNYIADDWVYTRTTNNSTLTITQEIFDLGQTAVPANPYSFLRYNCTNGGAGGDSTNCIIQYYNSVQTLSGQEITLTFYARSSTSNIVYASLIQHFGTGGSPSMDVPISLPAVTLSTTWQQYTATATLPSVIGKTLGDNGDDNLQLRFNFPLNQPAIIDLVNIQNQHGSESSDFPYITINDQKKVLDKTFQGLFTTGDFKLTINPIAAEGWAVCNDGTIGDNLSGASFAALYTKAYFVMLWNAISNAYAPIFNSDGTISTRGLSAEADYNAHKRLALTKTLGRILATGGSAQLTQVFTADNTTELLTIADSSSFYTGTSVVVTTTGTLPAPLAPATEYYVIHVDATNIQLATTLANAVAGIPINITTVGTGVQTVLIDYGISWTPGQFAGEYTHASTVAEMPNHDHPNSYTRGSSNDTGGGFVEGQSDQDTDYPLVITPQGGSQAHNNIQPTTFLYTHIKF